MEKIALDAIGLFVVSLVFFGFASSMLIKTIASLAVS